MQTMQIQTGLELLEGTDQAGLFVEIWHGMDREAFLSFKIERLHPHDESAWKPLADFIAGGLSKQYIWHFGKVEF